MEPVDITDILHEEVDSELVSRLTDKNMQTRFMNVLKHHISGRYPIPNRNIPDLNAEIKEVTNKGILDLYNKVNKKNNYIGVGKGVVKLMELYLKEKKLLD